MKPSLALFGTLLVTTFIFLKVLASDLLVNFGFILISFVFANILCRLIRTFFPRHMLPDLKNRAVLITGCSSGFGLGLAKKFDKLGMTVYATMRNPQCAGAQELKSTCSSRLHIVALDTRKDEDVNRVLKYVKDTLQDKVFWALINNAGITAAGELELTSINQFYEVFETNVFGYVRVTKAFLPLLRKFQGRVVCVGSFTSHVVIPGASHYSMTKHAIKAFVDGLRREMSTWSVSVHEVDPYFYTTVMTEEGNVTKQLEECWKNVADEIKQDYGPNYLEFSKNLARKLLKNNSSNVDEVLDDIIDAAVGAEPQHRYLPGFASKYQKILMTSIPIDMQDKVLEYVTVGINNKDIEELRRYRAQAANKNKKLE